MDSDESDDMSEARFKGWPTLNSPEDADATHRWARACLEMWEAERADLLAKVERLREERQAVLDCINLYGDETLHSALDGIGWPASGDPRSDITAHPPD